MPLCTCQYAAFALPNAKAKCELSLTAVLTSLLLTFVLLHPLPCPTGTAVYQASKHIRAMTQLEGSVHTHSWEFSGNESRSANLTYSMNRIYQAKCSMKARKGTKMKGLSLVGKMGRLDSVPGDSNTN